MQIQIFTIPIGDNRSALAEMNRFLRANKILEVQNRLISNENGASWCFCGIRSIKDGEVRLARMLPRLRYSGTSLSGIH